MEKISKPNPSLAEKEEKKLQGQLIEQPTQRERNEDPHMEEEVVINDILRHFDYYEPLLYTCADEYVRLHDRNNRIASLTSSILSCWSETDRQNYHNDPRQITWAQAHARALLDLEERRRQLPRRSQRHYPYEELLHQRVGELIERRMRRQGPSFRV